MPLFTPTRAVRPLLGVAVALVLLACITPGADPGARPPADPPVTVESAPPGQQEDGTKTPEEFEADLKAAVTIAEEYWTQQFQESGRSFQPIGRMLAYREDGELSCGGEGVPRNNAVFCPPGDYIAYDTNWAMAAFQQVGDAFIFYLLGHEYAHAIQSRLSIRHEFTIEHELQADCMAGAYIGDSVRAERLQLDKGDLDEFRIGLNAVADGADQPWFAPQSHGTAEQRMESFFNGYEKSLAACAL